MSIMNRTGWSMILACVVLITGATRAEQDDASTIDWATVVGQVVADPATAEQAAAKRLDHAASLEASPAADQALVRAALTYRLAGQMRSVPTPVRRAAGEVLAADEELAQALVFTMSRHDEPEQVYTLLNRLAAERGDDLARYRSLVAALCVVHDEPVEQYVNENMASAPDPIVVFDYYTRGEKHMNFGIRRVPAELLIYVVDIAASVEDMRWALKKYRGDDEVGRRFFEIRYDSAHFRHGRAKRVTEEGFSLRNIRKFGGVCADQAYFASTVGKAIGVPAVYTRARGAQLSHAWVGFLHNGRDGLKWNFDFGRYSAYQGVPGTIRCPQTHETINHSLVALSAELADTSTADRNFAAACAEAAGRLLYKDDDRWRLPVGGRPVREQVDADAVLALLERGLRRSAGDRGCWTCVADLAATGAMTIEHKQRWAQVVLRLCGDRYPDFAMDLLSPMIETVDDVRAQQALWHRLGKAMPRRRLDLTARVVMAEARMWEKAGERGRAGRCYLQVIERFINDGPYVLDAMDECARLLEAAGNATAMLEVYDDAWKRVDRPKDSASEFRRQSNWAQIGQRYASALANAGRASQAQQVQRRLDRELGER